MAQTKAQLSALPGAPTHADVQNAYLILEHAHDASAALLNAFDASRKARRAGGGNTTDEEQNLLRAMLVFAGAGLDASLKRLIEDCLPLLARRDAAVQTSLESFAARRLRDEAARSADAAKGFSLLSKAIASSSPQSVVVAAYVEDLIGSSLQSVDRLGEALNALGLKGAVSFNAGALRSVFEARNKIIHEMDMDLSLPNRRRTSRKRDPMIDAANALLNLGFAFGLPLTPGYRSKI